MKPAVVLFSGGLDSSTCLAIAREEGFAPHALTVRYGQRHAHELKAAERIAQTMPGQYSSTAQDLARGKQTEIDYLNGVVVRKGEALGVSTPVNRVLLAMVKLLAAKSR